MLLQRSLKVVEFGFDKSLWTLGIGDQEEPVESQVVLLFCDSYELHHDIIPIKTYRDQTTGALKRHKSDEYLYADPQAVSPASPWCFVIFSLCYF